MFPFVKNILNRENKHNVHHDFLEQISLITEMGKTGHLRKVSLCYECVLHIRETDDVEFGVKKLI